MKKIFTTFFLTLFSAATFAQSKISGGVYSENSSPVNFANIVLMSADSSFLSGTITDENGKFSVEKKKRKIFKHLMSWF